jgi:hypothetical protein
MWHAWERKLYKVLVGKPEGRRPSGRLRRRWEDGIKMDLRLWLEGGVQNGSSWLRIGSAADSCKYDDEPAGSGAMELVMSHLQNPGARGGNLGSCFSFRAKPISRMRLH